MANSSWIPAFIRSDNGPEFTLGKRVLRKF